MLGDFDIRQAAREILNVGRMVETDGLSDETGGLEAGNANGFVNGDMAAGVVVKGERAVLVGGSVSGEKDRVCRITAKGEVVVTGSVTFAQIAGRSIRIGGRVENCQLRALEGVEVGGDLSRTEVVAGDFDAQRREIEALSQAIQQEVQEREAAERHVRSEERRMDRLMKATRFSFEYGVGKIIQHQHSRLQIDLRPFYQALGNKSEEEVDRALKEFFAKGVVGLLARVHVNRIRNNPGRLKVFRGVVQSLYEFFWEIRDLDKRAEHVAQSDARLNALVGMLGGQTGEVFVRGRVMPQVEMSFMLPEAERLQDGDVSIGTELTRIEFLTGDEQGPVKVCVMDVNGIPSVLYPSLEDLQGVWVHVEEGQAVLDRAACCEEVA